jgi:hypothetical protein
VTEETTAPSAEGTAEKKSNREYFPKATQDAIIRYNASTDPEEREEIYRTEISVPLNKLAENVINTFKFPYIKSSFEDTKRQVVSFLVMNLHKYTEENGKAFSYLSVIAKNYLILHNNVAYRQERRSVSLSETGDSQVSVEEMMHIEAPDARSHDDSSEFVRLMIAYWDKNLMRIFKKKRDIQIANAVIELFRRADGIESFNKKSLYVLIREMTDCKTNYITKVVNKMKVITARQLQEYYSEGTIDSDDSKFLTNR